jgi:hypothetical protein
MVRPALCRLLRLAETGRCPSSPPGYRRSVGAATFGGHRCGGQWRNDPLSAKGCLRRIVILSLAKALARAPHPLHGHLHRRWPDSGGASRIEPRRGSMERIDGGHAAKERVTVALGAAMATRVVAGVVRLQE